MKILNAIVSVFCFLACMALIGFVPESRNALPLLFFIILFGIISSVSNLLILFLDSDELE